MKEPLHISPKSVFIWSLRYLLASLSLFFIFTLFLSSFGHVIRIGFILFIAVGLFYILFFFPCKYQRFRCYINRHAIWLSGGVFFHKDKTMPVKQIHIVQGISSPLSRLMGLRGILLKGAGGSLYLPMLSKPEYEKIENLLLTQAVPQTSPVSSTGETPLQRKDGLL